MDLEPFDVPEPVEPRTLAEELLPLLTLPQDRRTWTPAMRAAYDALAPYSFQDGDAAALIIYADDVATRLVRMGLGRASQEPPEMRIENGWLVEVVGGCTCGGGPPWGHEPGCGREPVLRLDTLDGSEEYTGARNALAALVDLKDGPRDEAYYAAKEAAWQRARDVLGRTEPEGGTA